MQHPVSAEPKIHGEKSRPRWLPWALVLGVVVGLPLAFAGAIAAMLPGTEHHVASDEFRSLIPAIATAKTSEDSAELWLRCRPYHFCRDLTDAVQALQKNVGTERFSALLKEEGFELQGVNRLDKDSIKKAPSHLEHIKKFRTQLFWSDDLVIWSEPKDATVVGAYLAGTFNGP